MKTEIQQLEVLDALSTEIAILTGEGTIAFTNEAWKKRASSGIIQLIHPQTAALKNYTDILTKLVNDGYDFALQALLGINRVLKGEAPEYVLEYHSVYPTQKERFLFKVKRMNEHSSNLVITQESVTAKQQTIMREKDALVQEMHHRVKNNLALVVGILQLQELNSENEECIEALNNTRSRIYSIAAIHELLYQSDTFSSLDVGQYLSALATMTASIHLPSADDIPMKIKSDVARMSITKAVPFGLLFSELLGSAMKHYVAIKGNSDISVLLQNGSNKYRLSIRHGNQLKNGSDVELRGYDSMSTTLIQLLKTQLNASIESKISKDYLDIMLEFSV